MGMGERWLEVRAPGAQTHLVLATVREVQQMLKEKLGPMSHVWFDCDDLAATFADLRARGVEFPVEPQPAPWNQSGSTRWAQFADDDGTVYGLTERIA